MNRRIHTIFTIAGLSLVSSVLSSAGFAATWAILPGFERDVLALVAPHELGDEVAPDWTLGPIAIEGIRVTFELAGPGGETAALRAVHPTKETAEPKSSTFAYELAATSDAGLEAARALAEIVRSNDRGLDLWKSTQGDERVISVSPRRRWNTVELIAVIALVFAASFGLWWALKRRRTALAKRAPATSDQVAGGAQDVDVADDADEVSGGGVDDGERTDPL